MDVKLGLRDIATLFLVAVCSGPIAGRVQLHCSTGARRMFQRAALVLHTPARWSHDCVKIVDGLRFVMGLKILWILCVLRSSVWYELFCRPRCLGGEGVSHSDRGSYDTSAVRPPWFYILRPFSRSDREGIL